MEVLHNPRCGKSRQCLAFLDANAKKYTVIKYLENPLTFKEIKSLLAKLAIPPIDLVRKKEKIWIENFASQSLNDDQIIQAMVDNPILIERPIVIDGNKATISRTEKTLKDVI
jgi:arsenate reductase